MPSSADPKSVPTPAQSERAPGRASADGCRRDDDGLFDVVGLQDDTHAGVTVCLVDASFEQLQRGLRAVLSVVPSVAVSIVRSELPQFRNGVSENG